MNGEGRILIVDDEERWRKELVETLERVGFQADSASTAAEALEQLDNALYHVLVLDIRMVHTDQSNIEGITLLGELDKRGLSEATKVIMLSAFGTPEHMRTSFRKYKVVDFLSKDDFDNQEFLENMRQVFSQHVKINLGLEMHWQPRSGPEQAVSSLVVDGIRIKRGTPLQSQIAAELEDLLRRLFYSARSILVRPLSQGRSGTGVLGVQPFYSTTGGGHEVVVKFGEFSKVEVEYNNFREYVQPFIGGGRNTTVLDLRRTTHLGGIIYSLLGTSNDRLIEFGEFYHSAAVPEIKDVLDRLFHDTCGAWYANRGHLQLLNLTEEYQRLFEYTPEKLEQVLSEQLKTVQGKQKLHFNSLKGERTFTNPMLATAGLPLVRPTYKCTTHGDCNPHNLLVDSTRHIWLIDFQGTYQSHILRDVAMLDSAVRFQLLLANEANLEERLQMEEILCSIERFREVDQLLDKLQTGNSALVKCYATVVHLRAWARRLVEQNPDDDMSEYYIALLYNAMNTIRFSSSMSSGQREHAVLCASLLVDRLGLGK